MNNKTRWTIVGAVAILLLINMGISSRSDKNSNKPIKIGVVVPLSGDYASFGEKIRNGMEIARQEWVDKNIQVDVIYEDACMPKDAVSAVTKLVTVDKVDLIGGSFCLIGLIPSIPILEQHNIIAFNTAADPDSILNNKNILSTNFSIKTDALKIANYIGNNLHARKVAIVYYNNDFGKSYQSNIRQELLKIGSEVVFEQGTPSDARDFKTILAEIKKANPDAISLTELGPSLAIFLKQARSFGINVPIVGYYENEGQSLIVDAGAASEGFIISSADPINKSPALQAFILKYVSLHGSVPDTLSFNAYDSLNLQVDAIRRCGNHYDCLLSDFKSVKDYPGLSGNITIQQDGSASKPTIFKVVKGGEFVKI